MEITNPNYNTMPEQVNQNTKDIAVLKNTVKTPAIIYNATVEMLQDAGVINQSNITQQVTNTVNAFILDTVGKLFRIVTVQNDQVYVAYCASITGPQGTPGADGVGIQSITSIAPTQDNGYTVTPVTFTDTNGNQITLNVRAKNGEFAQVDNTLSQTSENPLQNKVITDKIIATKNYAILNSTYVNTNYNNIFYFKIGNMVTVVVDNQKLREVRQTNDVILASGLPRPISSTAFVITNLSHPLSVRVDENGNIKNFYDEYTPSINLDFRGTISYLTND